MQDITQEVSATIARSGISTGVVHLFNIGSTATLGTIEFEPGLEADFPEMLDRLIPASREYGHEQTWHDGNGHSHLQASMLGPGLTIPVAQARPILGTWQQIFHLECDNKPRDREIVVTIIGE
jgi:secondary thiamine-phosphate synthase enzyme